MSQPLWPSTSMRHQPSAQASSAATTPGSALAAVAGILFAIKVGGNISFRMGYYPGVIAFAAAVLGGIGSIRGAVVGGLIIGATQAVGDVIYDGYGFAFAFGLMTLVILFRPWGIFGRPEASRA